MAKRKGEKIPNQELRNDVVIFSAPFLYFRNSLIISLQGYLVSRVYWQKIYLTVSAEKKFKLLVHSKGKSLKSMEKIVLIFMEAEVRTGPVQIQIVHSIGCTAGAIEWEFMCSDC